jgi:agmatine deiminase
VTGSILSRGIVPLILGLAGCAPVLPWGEAPPGKGVRLAGEFEEVERVVVGWDPGLEAFYLDALGSLGGRVPVTIVADVSDHPRQIRGLLADNGIAAGDVDIDIVSAPTDSIWVRDFGPFVVRAGAERVAIDFTYTGREADNGLTAQLASRWGLQLAEMPLELEGGNLLANGRGDCISSELVLETNPTVSEARIRGLFADMLGCRRTFFLPTLEGEATGHVDMYVSFTGPRDVMVGRYRAGDDPVNARRLEEAAVTLGRAGFRVRRVPMPPNHDGVFRTYVNAATINDAVLVPVYVDTDEGEAEALEAFAAAYPDREIIPIASSELIKLEGAVHCATLTIAR